MVHDQDLRTTNYNKNHCQPESALIRLGLGFFRVVFPGGWGQFEPPSFIFQEELI